jgi:hypothetical protein
MTREEFIASYCEHSKVPWEQLSQHLDAVPCDCGDATCAGWKMVAKDDGGEPLDLWRAW